MADHNNSTPATPTITTSSTDPLIPLVALTSGQLPLKLTHLHYPSWRAQFNSLLLGYDLQGFIDGTHPCPDRTSATFSSWMRQDQLLLHAIRISVSDSIAPLIASTTASKEAWDKLTRLYASRSRSRVMSLKERLVRPRDSSSLNEYLSSIKNIADELALIDTPVYDDDITIAILNGVGHEFKELTAGIRAREHPISYEELHDKLIDYEAYLKREDLWSPSSVLSANTTQRYNSHRGHQSTWSSNRKAVLPHHFHPQSSWSTSRQFSSTQQASPWHSNRNNYQRRGYRGVCQFCDQQGHSAKQCTRAKGLLGPSPTAHCTTTNTAPRQPWLLDSAATNHVTSDLHNLSLHSPYDGPDSILIGDGTGLRITHSGSTTLSPFTISNVLCVPSIQKKSGVCVSILQTTSNFH